MNFKKRDLLTLLIGLFLFASCKESTNIGLDLDPNTAIQGDLVDSLTVRSASLSESPINTNNLNRHPLGFITDPLFGTTESSLAISVSLPYDAYNFGLEPVIDSAVLIMNYGGQFYGDSTSIYHIEAHQLANNIQTQPDFLNTRTYAKTGPVLGFYRDIARPTDSVKFTDIVTGGPDTVKAVTAQMRIRLDRDFIQNNILNLPAASLRNNAAFAAAFKGIKVELDKANSSGTLGMMFFDFASTVSGLELHYKRKTSATTTTIDTVVVRMPIERAKNPIAASFKHDYTGTPVATQLATPAVQYPVTYMTGLAGVRNKITFPYLSKLSAELGKVVVNKAELIVDISPGTDVAPFLPSPRIGLYFTDVAGQRTNLSDRNFFQGLYNSEQVGDLAFGGFYSISKKRYMFTVTDHIQKLLDGTLIDNGMFLAVTPTTEMDYLTPTGTSAARVVVGSGAKDASGALINPNSRIKLNIYYTKVK